MADHALHSRPPFADLAVASNLGSGVIATDRDGLGLATVAVGEAQIAALSQRVRERYDIELPRGPIRRQANDVAFAGVGPCTWLVSQEMGANHLSSVLTDEIGAVASVSDQSDGYAVLRLAGPHVEATLIKMVPIDLHSRAFRPGDVASTVALQVGATLWRLEDDPGGGRVFEIAVFRSFADHFWYLLSQSAAEFGLSMTSEALR